MKEKNPSENAAKLLISTPADFIGSAITFS